MLDQRHKMEFSTTCKYSRARNQSRVGSYHHRVGCPRVEQNRMQYGISWCITRLSRGLIIAMSTEYEDGLKHDVQK